MSNSPPDQGEGSTYRGSPAVVGGATLLLIAILGTKSVHLVILFYVIHNQQFQCPALLFSIISAMLIISIHIEYSISALIFL